MTSRRIRPEVVKHSGVKRGFVLLPRRWVVERFFAWATRFRRLAKDYERLPETVAGLHFVAFVASSSTERSPRSDQVRNMTEPLRGCSWRP